MKKYSCKSDELISILKFLNKFERPRMDSNTGLCTNLPAYWSLADLKNKQTSGAPLWNSGN